MILPSAQPPRFQQLLATVEEDLTYGWLWCQTANRYGILLQAHTHLRDTWFHQGSYLACERETIMCVARLTDADKEALSLRKLLNYAASHPEEFIRAEAGEVAALVASGIQWLDNDPVVERVRRLRDRVLAHTDRRRLSNPTEIAAHHVQLGDVEESLRAIHTMTNELRRHHDNSTYLLDSIDQGLDVEVDAVVKAYTALHIARMAEFEARRARGPAMSATGVDVPKSTG